MPDFSLINPSDGSELVRLPRMGASDVDALDSSRQCDRLVLMVDEAVRAGARILAPADAGSAAHHDVATLKTVTLRT